MGALYDRHAGAMLALALRWCPDRASAEDLVQDVFVEAWRKIRAYDPTRGSVRSWLITTLRSRSLDRRRSLARSREDLVDARADGVTSPAAHSGERADLTARLAGLGEAQQQVIRLAYFEGWTMQEIADQLGQPIGTVKARLSRALARLRAQMTEDGP